MISAFTQFPLPGPMTRAEAREAFSQTASRYRKIKGLIRKYYVLSEDGNTAGGVYLWQSRADAENFYTDEWKHFVGKKYGVEPLVTFFECPVVVDNAAGEIIMDE